MVDNARFKNILGKTQLQISELGFGSAPLGSLRDNISVQDAEALIDNAFEMGIRYFDTAPLYGEGRSERHVGNALKKFNRKDYLLSTKVGRLLRASNTSNTFDVVYDYDYQGAISSLEESLERLQLEYVDILLCHDIDVWTHKSKQPQIFAQATQGILPALLDLREKGRIGAFGIGVNEWQVCEQVIELFDIDCILLAGRFTLLEQEALDSLLPKCAEEKISIIIGGPYNSGLLATTEKNIATYDYRPASDQKWNQAQAIRAICDTHDVDIRAAALQYPLRHSSVVSVIPGAKNIDELKMNIQLMDHVIPDALWNDLDDQGLTRKI